MADFMMIMKGGGTRGDWQPYIDKLVASGKFRGGSAFGNGRCVSTNAAGCACVATGFMRFEADSIDEVQALLAGNPVYESGGAVELHELVVA